MFNLLYWLVLRRFLKGRKLIKTFRCFVGLQTLFYFNDHLDNMDHSKKQHNETRTGNSNGGQYWLEYRSEWCYPLSKWSHRNMGVPWNCVMESIKKADHRNKRKEKSLPWDNHSSFLGGNWNVVKKQMKWGGTFLRENGTWFFLEFKLSINDESDIWDRANTVFVTISFSKVWSASRNGLFFLVMQLCRFWNTK